MSEARTCVQGCGSIHYVGLRGVFERVVSVLTAVRCELRPNWYWVLVQNATALPLGNFISRIHIQIWGDLVSEGKRSSVLHRPVPTSFRSS